MSDLSTGKTDEYNGLLCPLPGCDAPLYVVWSTQGAIYALGGFCRRGEGEGVYGPDQYELATWKVECQDDHVLLTAFDDWPGCWEAYQREEVSRSDEEGWDFDVDRVRTYIAAMASGLSR